MAAERFVNSTIVFVGLALRDISPQTDSRLIVMLALLLMLCVRGLCFVAYRVR